MPIPITTAPSIWLRPASGLRMRPASMTVTTRLTRNRAISGCHVTSTKWQPNECVENFGFGLPNVASDLPLPVTRRRLARRSKSANGTPLAGPLGFHKDPAAFERQFVGLALLERRSRGCRGDGQQRLRLPCQRRQRRPGPPIRSPSSRPRVGPSGSDVSPSATSTLSSGTPVFSARELREDRVRAGADVLRAAGDARRAIVAQLDVRLGGKSRGDPRSTRPFPSRASSRRASSSRLRGFRFDQPNFSAPSFEALEIMARRERNAQSLVDLRLVEDAKSNGIDLELIGQFVHRRFGRVEPGHGARAAHVGR